MHASDWRLIRDGEAVSSEPDTLVLRIAGARDKSHLLRQLSEDLRFPGWFGHNWDALYDCLCDLGWIPERRVVLVHERIDPAFPEDELRVYLQLLREAVEDWRTAGSEHELVVAFSEADLARLEAAIDG